MVLVVGPLEALKAHRGAGAPEWEATFWGVLS